MDKIAELEQKIYLLYGKQNEIIERLNKVIEKLNRIPRDIKADKEILTKRELYLEQEMDRIKRRFRFPDEDI